MSKIKKSCRESKKKICCEGRAKETWAKQFIGASIVINFGDWFGACEEYMSI